MRLWCLKCFLCRQHTRFWKRDWFIIFIHPLSSTTVCHAASLQISDYVVDKQVHVWLLHAETTSAMKSMLCPENTKNRNEYSYDSLLLLAWASFANIFTIEVNTVIRLHNCFNLKTKLRLKQLWRRITMSWYNDFCCKNKGVFKTTSAKNDASNHAGCWEEVMLLL